MGKTKKTQITKPDIRRVRDVNAAGDFVLTVHQRQAEKLFLNDLNAVEIARVIGCESRTIHRWITKFRWKEQLAQIKNTPEYIQRVLIEKLSEEVNGLVNKKGLSTTDADKIIKIVSAIKSLGREMDKLGNILLLMTEFMGFISGKDKKLADMISTYLGEFTNKMVEKYG